MIGALCFVLFSFPFLCGKDKAAVTTDFGRYKRKKRLGVLRSGGEEVS